MHILFIMKQKLSSLTKAERKLAEWILSHSAEVIHMSTQALSEASQTSPATVIRLCYSLGLSGFTDLKLKLSANLPAIKEDLYSDIVKEEPIDQIKKKIQLKITSAIEENVQILDNEVILRILDLLNKKKHAYAFGIGASGIVAEDFYQKMLRAGYNVTFDKDYHLLAAAIVASNEPAFVLLISNSGEKDEVIFLAKIAQTQNIPIVAMTHEKNSTLANYADILFLTADGGEAPLRSSATNSLLVQLFTIDVLFSAFASSHYEKTMANLSNTKKAVEKTRNL